MREILFRGKRIDNGKWVEGGIAFEDYTDKVYIVQWNPFSLGSFGYIEVIPETIGQFTGLTANDKEIFEGDIVRALEEGEVIGCCEIKFGEYSVGHIGFYADWYAGRMAKYFRNDLGHWATHKTIEVIGNRADNKELLEVDNGT